MKRRSRIQVAARREAAGLSQAALARMVGIQQSHLRKIERGEVEAPSIHLAVAITAALGANVGDIPDLFGTKAA